jgi:cytochrome c-type biogenesis protein CcmH/NrfG
MSRKISCRALVLLSVIVLLLCLLCVSVSLWFTRSPQPPEPDLAEVDPDVAEAITAACNKVRQQPNNGAVWGQLGMVFFVHDFQGEAERCFAQAERLDSADGRWPYLRGLSLILTNPDASIPCLQRAVERCGDHPLIPRLRLAETLLNQGRLDEAELHLEQARRMEPYNVRVQLGLGRLAVLRSQWHSALEHLDPCTNDVHAQRLAHRLQAEVWTRLGEPDKAHVEQKQAAEAPKDHSWPDPFVEDVLLLQRGLPVRLQQAQKLFAQRQSQQAVQLLEETIQRYPQAASARLLLGELWRHLGRVEQAEQAFTQAVQIDPDSPDAWFRLGCIQAARGRMREAAESFHRAINRKPDHADAHVNLGHCLQELGDAAGAADAFRAALRCRPDYERAQAALRQMQKSK